MPACWPTAPFFQFPEQPAKRTTLTRMGCACPGLWGAGRRAGLPRAPTPALLQLAPDTGLTSSPYLQDVPPDVVTQGPAQAVQDVQHLLLLQDAEETVQQDLEPHRHRLRPVEHQTADVKHHVGLHDLHLGGVVEVLRAELIQGCGGPARGPGAGGNKEIKRRGQRQRKEKRVTGSYRGLHV